MNQPTHKTAPQNHPISWSFFLSNSNGKEKDYESGFHYYGARYYWSELLTGWLSVDPMSDKYPGISSYAYCTWNPVKLVDPDGKEVDDDWYMTKSGEVKWDKNVKGPEDVPEGCVYLGKNPIIITSQEDNAQILYPNGTKDEVLGSAPTEKNRLSLKLIANIPAAISVALYDGPEIGPADVVAAASASLLTIIAGTCWIVEEFFSPSVDKSDMHQDAEHVKGARPSTWDKHTRKRSGEVTGETRNNNRGDKNKKHKSQPNPNRRKK